MTQQVVRLSKTVIVLLTALTPFAYAESYNWAAPDWLPKPPIPDDNPMTAEKVELGRHLFYDARLSANNAFACSSCHNQALAFTDAQATAFDFTLNPASKSAPSLANVGYFPTLTWDNPHMSSLEFQALIPLFGEDPVEMGNAGQENSLFEKLSAEPYYQQAFPTAFPERPNIDLFTLTRALAAFQRSLISADSPYDRYKYGGDTNALSEAAKRGEQHFFSHRFECYHCHQGIHFTDNHQAENSPWQETGFHNNGLYNIDGNYPKKAEGLSSITGLNADNGKFRTPSLRNIALTAPYMHDGSIADLPGVIAHYASGGRTIHEGRNAGIGAENPNKDGMIVGFTITENEQADLIAFLNSLTDESFISNPTFSDPWPTDHPASANRHDFAISHLKHNQPTNLDTE